MNIINPKIAFDSYYDQTKYKIAKRLALICAIIFAIFSIVFWKEPTEIIYYYILAFVITASAYLYILFSKKYKVIFYSLSIGATGIIIAASNFGSHALHYAAFSWAILACIVAFFGIGIRFGIFIVAVNIIGISCFSIFFIEDNIALINVKTLAQKINIAIEFTIILLLTGYTMYQFVLFHNYSNNKLRATNEILEEKNKLISVQYQEKTTLVKEIHHRVKNNLQIIISLLRLQKAELKSDEAKAHFSEAINRIMVMSLIHKKLYQEKELARINIKSYLTDLAKDIQSLSDLGFPIDIKIISDIENIGLKTIVPLGLLINELLTNSIKHAFLKKQTGLITIALKKDKDNNFFLTFSDNGKWIEPKEVKPSFGIELIGILTSQLEGEYNRTVNDKGTTYSFNIKNIDLEK